MPLEEKKSRPQKIMEFHNIKISKIGSSFGPFESCHPSHFTTCVEIIPISYESYILSCRWNYVLPMKGQDLLRVI